MSEDTAVAIAGPANGTGIGFAMALNPTTAEAAMKTAEWMAKSDLVPKAYHGKPHDIVIAAAMGARLGLDPFSALAGIAVVNGRPTLWGDSMLAVCQQRPDWGGMQVEWSGEGDSLACAVSIVRKGHGEYSGSFSVADAKTASLWKKQGPWTQYPRRMLELRARSYALRGAFADALAGFHAREEVADEPPTREVEATVRDMEPQPAKVRGEPAEVQDSSPEQEDSSPAPADEPEAEDTMAEDEPNPYDLAQHALTQLWKAGGKSVSKDILEGYGYKKLDEITDYKVLSCIAEDARTELAKLNEAAQG